MADLNLVQRHSISDRIIHWGNALLWLLLLASGIGLADHPDLAILGQGYPQFARSLVGGGTNLLAAHIGLGSLWIASFLLYAAINKSGTLFFLRSIFTQQKGDVTWLTRKGLHMSLGKDVCQRLGVSLVLPPQGYYNAGQRVLAVAIVLGCVAIALSGILMSLSPFIPAAEYPLPVAATGWAILIHHASVWLIVAGLFVHIYMAAIVKEERPALVSMFSGTVPEDYAKHHCPLWDYPAPNRNIQINK